MQPIVFNKAGKFMLTKFSEGKPDSLKPASCFFRNGVVQQITPNISINGTPIPDGNSLWDAANLDTGIEGTIAVQLGYMPTELYAFIMGDTSQKNQDLDFPYVDEEYTVPETGAYTVKLKNTPTADGVMVVDVHNATLSPTLDGDTLTFTAGDAGKAVYVSYYAAKTGVERFGLPKIPVRPAYQLIVVGEAVGEDDTLYEVATTVDRCKVLGNINPPSQGGTPEPITITFTILKPRGDLRAVDYMAVAI